MSVPFVIDNVHHRLADTLKHLLGQCGAGLSTSPRLTSRSPGIGLSKTAFNASVCSACCCADPQSGADLGLKADAKGRKARLKGDLEAELFTAETLKLVEDLIAFLHDEKVLVRLFDKGFLHARAYLFYQDKIGPFNAADRLRPYAAIVGSSNFTGPGLVSNRGLSLVHRIIWHDEDPRERKRRGADDATLLSKAPTHCTSSERLSASAAPPTIAVSALLGLSRWCRQHTQQPGASPCAGIGPDRSPPQP